MSKEAKDFFTPAEFQRIAFDCGVQGVPNPDLEPAFIPPNLMKFGQRFFNLGFNKGVSDAQQVAYDFLQVHVGQGWGEHYLKQVCPSTEELVNNALDAMVQLALEKGLEKEEIWPVIRALEAAKNALTSNNPATES